MLFEGGTFTFNEEGKDPVSVDYIKQKIKIVEQDEELQSYDSVVFLSHDANSEQRETITYHLSIEKIFTWWLPYFVCVSLGYIIICSLVMWGVAAHLTAPITQLTEIIRLNIKRVKQERDKTNIGSKQKAIQL
jgi:hypothetical protein